MSNFTKTVLVGKAIISLVIEQGFLCAEHALKDNHSYLSNTPSSSPVFFEEIVRKRHNEALHGGKQEVILLMKNVTISAYSKTGST